MFSDARASFFLLVIYGSRIFRSTPSHLLSPSVIFFLHLLDNVNNIKKSQFWNLKKKTEITDGANCCWCDYWTDVKYYLGLMCVSRVSVDRLILLTWRSLYYKIEIVGWIEGGKKKKKVTKRRRHIQKIETAIQKYAYRLLCCRTTRTSWVE